MITTVEEYNAKLGLIQDANYPSQALLLPKDEFIYEIDLNTRVIKAPIYLGVEKDHKAETIYFLTDRFFCGIDLANTSCLVQYVNALGEGRFFPVPFYDVTTYSGRDENKRYILASVTYANYNKGEYYILNTDGEYVISNDAFNPNETYYRYIDQPKILFPWYIGGEVSAAAGEIEYSVRFYKTDPTGKYYEYSLNTKTAKSRIMEGMETTEEQVLQYDADALSAINHKVDLLARDYQLYWIEA